MKEKTDKKVFYYVIGICFLYVLPIILANRYYNDDTQRVFYHYAGWSLDGRPLADIAIKLLCGVNNYIYDIFPLPLLISVLVYSIVSVSWSRMIYSADGVIGVIVSFLPISMPFFLTNLSYRFDCFGIVVSAVLLMIPFMYKNERKHIKLLVDAICILVSMCFYQGTVGLYLGLAFIVAFVLYIEGTSFIPQLVQNIASFIVGTVFYKVVIATMFVDKTGWRAEANSFIPAGGVFGSLWGHMYDLLILILDYAKGVGARQLLIVFVIWAFGGISLACITNRSSKTRIVQLEFLYCMLPAVSFLAAEMPMLILSHSYAQTRHQPQLLILMFVMALSLAIIYKAFPRVAIVSGIIVILLQFSFSYAYGNVLRSQKEYEAYIVHNIVRDIEKCPNAENAMTIGVSGTVPYSPIVESTYNLMPIFRDMVPNGIDNDGMLGGAIINHYSRNLLDFTDISQEDELYMQEHEPVSQNKVYDMFVNNDKVYIRFK